MAFSNLHVKASQDLPFPLALHPIYSLSNPAFTESSFVSCHSEAYYTTVRRLSTCPSTPDEDYGQSVTENWVSKTMDLDVAPSLQRTASHHSNASGRSARSQTVRVKSRKYTSYISSSASSISDKSLTSFPSFSPESPNNGRTFLARMGNGIDGTANTSRKVSEPASINSLTNSSPPRNRSALFEDAPFDYQNIPGALNNANDEHIERLIARRGAVALVRQMAQDLAQRNAQIVSLRRKADTRERALRKIILEYGLSNLDLETRLRAIEEEKRGSSDQTNGESETTEAGLEDMMTDAMSEPVLLEDLDLVGNTATIRAGDAVKALDDKPVNIQKTWKDYIWGGTSRKGSRANSVNGDASSETPAPVTNRYSASPRKSVLKNDIFQPSDATSSESRASSRQSVAAMNRERKPSSGLATLALKLVAGTTATSRDDGVKSRGRASSASTAQVGRDQSIASTRTTASARTAPAKRGQPAPRPIPRPRRAVPIIAVPSTAQERWDTMGASPQNTASVNRADNSGPVEMDTILPLDAQPPTVTQTYNKPYNQEFLTDRFGFIYDQRRKKRQKEAAERSKGKRSSRVEMLSSSRSAMSVETMDTEEGFDYERPDTPISLEEEVNDGRPAKRWQDYLKIATFPTELLSHTPSAGIPAFEVMEGGEVSGSPRITAEERGFLPSPSAVTPHPGVLVTSDNATISKPTISPTTPTPELPEIAKEEDVEPVKLLLKQLDDVHDSLQREKTVRWNDFLRKVRAERKRDGEAAAAVLAATADKGSQRPVAVMPEATLTDGEMVGVASLGNKGKVGRAKWNEFKTLVLGGIPVAYRAKIWAECSGAAALRIPGYYEDLANREGKDDPSIVAQIQMDINRTLTDNIFFRKGLGVMKLKEVLLAYSRRNTEVGYCQGMNLITACLLLIMPTAEDAFWLLASIIENILPRGYYDHSLLASRADQQVLRQYVSEILPKLSAHLDDLSIELEALTFQWFLSVFTDCLSAEALFRVWDVVFCTNNGSTFLFQVALALLKLNEAQLLGCESPAKVYTYINHQMTNHAISIDGLIHASEGLRKVVRRDEVEGRRERAMDAEREMGRVREERNEARRREREMANEVSTSANVSGITTPDSRADSPDEDVFMDAVSG